MMDDPYHIASAADLEALYASPSEIILKTKFDFLDDHALAMIREAPICFLASVGGTGADISPRGGEHGFVHVIDRKSFAIPDWPGNNKLETMHNLLEDPRCGVVFLLPGHDLFLRVNGTATLTRDPALLNALVEFNRPPKLAIRVQVDEAYFHCGKAIKRSRIWEPDSWPGRDAIPKIGRMMADQAKLADADEDELDAAYRRGIEEDLY